MTPITRETSGSPVLAPMAPDALERTRVRVEVEGAVQGVGFRPFLYRTASEHGLAGWIRNTPAGVLLEVEGPPKAVAGFMAALRATPPARAVVRDVAESRLEPVGLVGLRILPSEARGERTAVVLPDLATCPACLEDIRSDPRRIGYAFTNCTDCGPRFSIVRSLPYDRPNTTMAAFELCDDCLAEYHDPTDRRFHAQPTACPVCGPQLWHVTHPRRDGLAHPHLEPRRPEVERFHEAEALERAAIAIRSGAVVAVKGLGGFHLVADATDNTGIRRLRERKHRPTKPFAVMVKDLEMARALVELDREAEALLLSPEAPIVLLGRRRRRVNGRWAGLDLAAGVAPGNPYIGIMLPYTPLHHLLLERVDGPVVATSGNRTDEPICIDEREAGERLGDIADQFLLHDRPIRRPVDDSVVQIVAGAPRPVRRSRGYAPLPVRLAAPAPPILAVGGHLKNTIALARGRDVFLSQHIGDLETPEAEAAFETVIADFLRLYEVEPEAIAHDLHPDYSATRWAERNRAGRATVAVQHHHAHLAACLADTGHEGRALGVVWDGTGLGTDGTIWGGELLVGDAASYARVGRLRPFRLPGSEAAVREPKRVALALLHEAMGAAGLERVLPTPAGAGMDERELAVLGRMLDKGLNAPWTSSMGRLFDGVAALIGLPARRAGRGRAASGRVTFEGEAAMALEWAVAEEETGAYAFAVARSPAPSGPDILTLDWEPMLRELLADLEAGVDRGVMAARFHNGLVEVVGRVAAMVGEPHVALTGGCFQNRILTERAVRALNEVGVRPLLHQQVPANDGGLALGQVAVAAARLGGGAVAHDTNGR